MAFGGGDGYEYPLSGQCFLMRCQFSSPNDFTQLPQKYLLSYRIPESFDLDGFQKFYCQMG